MTKADLMEYIDRHYDDDDDIDLDDVVRDMHEDYEMMVEEIEERQHQSGFYAFQDLMDMRRRER